MSWIRMAIGGAAFLGVATVASAQAPQAPPQGGAAHQRGAERGERNEKAEDRDARDARLTRRIFAGIELTAAQQELVQKIREKSAAEKEALLPADGDRQRGDEATRAKIVDFPTRSQADYRAILTPEQQAMFDKNVSAIKERLERRAKKEKVK